MTVQHFSDDSFRSDVIEESSRRPVLVDFWAPWCGPCRMVTPLIEEAAESLGETAAVGKVNVDENPEVASKYGIKSIPTVLVYRHGNVVDALVGVQSAKDYQVAAESASGLAC